jgi:hypothetical protein
VSALDKLVVRLASIQVKDYYRMVNGKRVKVSGYKRAGGMGIDLKSSGPQTKVVKPKVVPTRAQKAAPKKSLRVKGPVVGGEKFAPGYTPKAASYEQKTRPKKDGKVTAPGYTPEAAAYEEKTKKADAKSAVSKLAEKTGKPDPNATKEPAGTKEDPVMTDDVEVAAKALGEGKYVQLDQKRTASTLLDKLADIVEDAKAKGEKAPTYDLCKVTVPKTNLFCVETKGIPRIKMPQLGGEPVEGSRAAGFPRNKQGEVDLSEEFLTYLTEERKIAVEETTEAAEYLKASQNELNGAKVAGIARAVETGNFDPNRGTLFVSKDNYVVDGHHRWAAMVGVSIKEEKTIEMPVRRVDIDIISLLALANNWTKSMGIKQQGV